MDLISCRPFHTVNCWSAQGIIYIALHCFTLFQMRFCNRKLHLHHHCLSVWPCLALLRHTSRQDLMFWHVLICFDPTWNRLSTAWIHQSGFVVSCRLYKPTCPTCRVLVCRSRVVRVSLISLGLSSTDCGGISRSRSIWNQGRFAKTCHCESKTYRDIPRLSRPSLRVSPAPWRQTLRHEWSLCKKVLGIIWKTIGREKCDVLIHAQHAQADQLISRRLTCLWCRTFLATWYERADLLRRSDVGARDVEQQIKIAWTQRTLYVEKQKKQSKKGTDRENRKTRRVTNVVRRCIMYYNVIYNDITTCFPSVLFWGADAALAPSQERPRHVPTRHSVVPSSQHVTAEMRWDALRHRQTSQSFMSPTSTPWPSWPSPSWPSWSSCTAARALRVYSKCCLKSHNRNRIIQEKQMN